MDACTALLLAPIPKRRDAFRVGMAYERPRILSYGAKLEVLEFGPACDNDHSQYSARVAMHRPWQAACPIATSSSFRVTDSAGQARIDARTALTQSPRSV